MTASTTVNSTKRATVESTSQPSIQALNLTKTFANRVCVDNLSFSIYPGELYVLLGDNGSGKTTTINMLTTLLRPTQGQFFICGFDGIRQIEHTKGAFGVVSQDAAVYQELTGYENLAFIAALYGVTGEAAHQRIVTLLEQAGLNDRAHDLAGDYSGGMQRKLSIAIAMLHQPRVIFMDEPTIGLDPASRRQIWEQLSALRSSGVTILLTTHYLEEAELLADRIGIIREGKMIIEGTIDQLRDRLHGLRTVVVSLGRGANSEELNKKLEYLRQHYCEGRVKHDAVRGTLVFNRSKERPIAESLNVIIKNLADARIDFEELSTTEASLEDMYLAVSPPAESIGNSNGQH